MKIRLIDSYIAKNFLVKFLQISLGFSLIIFFINFLDSLEKIKDSNAPFFVAVMMAFLHIPEFLNDVIPSLVLISSIITFFTMSSRSEITIIRVSGFFIWQILRPVALSAIFLGIFWVTIFEPLSIQMGKKFDALEGKYVKHELREVMAPINGIWLKQLNSEKPEEELIIQAKKVYKENLEMGGVTVWFFDQNGQFYKKIDAKKMFMKEKIWLLEDAIINDSESINKKAESISIPTDLEPDFVMQKIVNNFQNVKSFSVFVLPKLIKELKESGFESEKFEVYFHSLLSRPLLFLAMVFIACYFGLNHIRNHNAVLMIFLGIVVGLILYITSSVVNALGSSGLIPVFASTWIVATICLAIGVLLIYRKERV